MAPIWIIFIVFAGLSWLVGAQLKSKFKAFSKIPINGGLSGKDVAERMLSQNGVNDVKVISVDGQLTDHYNPLNKTVNLSTDVFNGNSVAAAAVAAHECGHAIQHAHAYSFLQMRSKLVPVVSITSKWVQWVLLAGVILVQTFPAILLAGIVMFALMTLFSFITLPVEIDASRRALAWLNGAGITSSQTHPKAQEALRWAAYTYVVAALASLATLLYYVYIFLGNRR
ncbi:MAG: zinc metallopeptidase [Bacteroidales bacterium]|nr:zinc metallopeptidase [Bacteroidales bacterium]MDZ4204588.1 zinc metallopeptidase [Bacteroidales bacterium]